MKTKIQKGFIESAAIILFVVAAAKIYSATGSAPVLDVPDRLLGISHRVVFYAMGALELALSAFLLMGNSLNLKCTLLAWIATNFLIYRIGLRYLGAPDYCNCLGNLTAYLPVSPRSLNWTASVALGWMLLGSYGFLVFDWITQRKARASQPEPVAQTQNAST